MRQSPVRRGEMQREQPQASPSLRLFTSPAWLIEESVRSFQETRAKSARTTSRRWRGDPRGGLEACVSMRLLHEEYREDEATKTDTIPSANGQGRNP